jgi:aspartate racemase
VRTIGLLGGMSWESTVPYYRTVNEVVKARLGGLHSAKVVLVSVDFAVVERLQHTGDWDAAGDLLAAAARSLEAAGADFVVLCTNTMHKVAPVIEAAVGIPLLHIADPTAAAIQAAGLHAVGLLGTRFTMEQDFYVGRLEGRHGLTVLTPPPADREIVHRVIYDELVLGQTLEPSRAAFRRVIGDLVARGAEGVVLGCTEISLLITAQDARVPLLDTTVVHATAAAERSIEELAASASHR